MAGRIRTVKPELLEDERTAGLTHEAFRLFISMLLLSDDYGNLRACPRQIEAAVFWARSAQTPVAELLAELESAGLVHLYQVRGQAYGHLCGWQRHQKVDKPSKPRCPGPDDPEASPSRHPRETVATPSRESPETLAPDLRSPISDHDPDRERDHAPAREEVRTVERTEQISDELKKIAMDCGLKDITKSWLKFTGHFSGKGERINVASKWQTWCADDAAEERERAASPAPSPPPRRKEWQPPEHERHLMNKPARQRTNEPDMTPAELEESRKGRDKFIADVAEMIGNGGSPAPAARGPSPGSGATGPALAKVAS